MDKRGQESIGGGSSKKLIWGIVIAVVVIVILIGAYFVFRGGGEKEVTWKTYTDKKLGFSVEYPSNWKQTLEESKVFFISPTTANVNIQATSKQIYKTRAEYVADIINQLKSLEGSNFKSQKELTLNGMSATEISVSYRLQGVAYDQDSITIEKDDVYYMISYAAWGGAYGNYLPVYEHLKNSFTFNKTSQVAIPENQNAAQPASPATPAASTPTAPEQTTTPSKAASAVTKEELVSWNLQSSDLPAGFSVSNTESNYYEDVYVFSKDYVPELTYAGWQKADRRLFYHMVNTVSYDASMTSTIEVLSDSSKADWLINNFTAGDLTDNRYSNAGDTLGSYGSYSVCERGTIAATYTTPVKYNYICRVRKDNYYLNVNYMFSNPDAMTLTQYKDLVTKVVARIP